MPTTEPIKILIVDQSVRCRETLQCALRGLEDIVVVGVSPNGKLGLDRARSVKPDLVILDASLTDVPAPEFTRTVLEEMPQTGILVSSLDVPEIADSAILALEAGAFDFVMKPTSACPAEVVETLQRMLLPKIRGFSIRRYSRMAKSLSPSSRGSGPQDSPRQPVQEDDPCSRLSGKIDRRGIEVVLIGASTGGPEALSHLLRCLPPSFPVPIVVVLHMPKLFTSRMAAAIDRGAAVQVREAQDGDALSPGVVYLAPGGVHLVVQRATRRRVLLKTLDGPPENGCKPSVDALFRSAAEVFGEHALAVVLTGMGSDGTNGLKALREHRAPALVQDEQTSTVWGMPGSVVQAGCADEVLPLEAIAGRIIEIVESH